jgi:2'-5' RNA ligase
LPPADVKAKAGGIRRSFRALDWIVPVPDHFLHVSLGGGEGLDVREAERAWRDVEPFELVYRRANAFHEAVIIEAHGEGVRMLVERAFPHADLSLLLPHISVGYVTRRESAAELRRALEPFRDVDVGGDMVDEIFLCEVPVAKSTYLQPWRVLASVRLRRS